MRTIKEVRNKTMSVSVSPELFAKVEKLARQSGVSKSSYVSVLLAEAIRQKDIVNSALDDFPVQLAEKLKEILQNSDVAPLS